MGIGTARVGRLLRRENCPSPPARARAIPAHSPLGADTEYATCPILSEICASRAIPTPSSVRRFFFSWTGLKRGESDPRYPALGRASTTTVPMEVYIQDIASVVRGPRAQAALYCTMHTVYVFTCVILPLMAHTLMICIVGLLHAAYPCCMLCDTLLRFRERVTASVDCMLRRDIRGAGTVLSAPDDGRYFRNASLASLENEASKLRKLTAADAPYIDAQVMHAKSLCKKAFYDERKREEALRILSSTEDMVRSELREVQSKQSALKQMASRERLVDSASRASRGKSTLGRDDAAEPQEEKDTLAQNDTAPSIGSRAVSIMSKVGAALPTREYLSEKVHSVANAQIPLNPMPLLRGVPTPRTDLKNELRMHALKEE